MKVAAILALRVFVAISLLGVTVCRASHGTGPSPDAHESSNATNVSCTGVGSYRVATSAVGPTPGLPQSAKGASFTPAVGLAGTDVGSAVPTVSPVLWANEPKPSIDESFKRLAMGEQITFRGYSLTISSICADSAQFELVSQQE
ncbi:hypothetical protein [Arthrobacter glacialis]|uniref:hypothetical protein n=1 Tax=Arthrobacter glacialis TaxID=1664 RepID=UPI000CD3FEA6|nr:hypothetical protein [Arthrobacter glacialis]POH57016.1 hypothetical protein CVS28_18270 [Arthrobacter glacialis]